MRTGLHPYSLSQPPPLLLELMDKLGIELILTKSIRIQVYTCSNVLRGHACNSTGHRTGRVQLELVEVKKKYARAQVSCGGNTAVRRALRWTSSAWTRRSKKLTLHTFTQ